MIIIGFRWEGQDLWGGRSNLKKNKIGRFVHHLYPICRKCQDASAKSMFAKTQNGCTICFTVQAQNVEANMQQRTFADSCLQQENEN